MKPDPSCHGSEKPSQELMEFAPREVYINGSVVSVHSDDSFDWEDDEVEAESAPASHEAIEFYGKIDLDLTELNGKKVQNRRANATDKEFAAMVHKSHLLCLISRAIQVDTFCEDSELQASVLSLTPESVWQPLCSVEPNVSHLPALLDWFSSSFQVAPKEAQLPTKAGAQKQVPFYSEILSSLHSRRGPHEALTAISVALLRSLGLTARFVALLDASPLKPDSESLEYSKDWDPSANGTWTPGVAIQAVGRETQSRGRWSLGKALTRSVTLLQSSDGVNVKEPVTAPVSGIDVRDEPGPSSREATGDEAATGTVKPRRRSKKEVEEKKGEEEKEEDGKEEEKKGRGRRKRKGKEEEEMEEKRRQRGSRKRTGERKVAMEEEEEEEEEKEKQRKKRKGDEEFELQLAVAMAATEVGSLPSRGTETATGDKREASGASAAGQAAEGKEEGEEDKRKRRRRQSAAGRGTSWSRSFQEAAHCWAEVFLGGRWVPVDCVRRQLAATSEEAPGVALGRAAVPRYVLGFSGGGAKDVTKRYVPRWSAVAPTRLTEASDWWSQTMAAVRRLERKRAPKEEEEEGGEERKKTKEEEEANEGDGKSGAVMGQSGEGAEKGGRFREGAVGTTSGDVTEDFEMETRVLTEPLPTNQQAYRGHPLYVLERWMSQRQVLRPRGPVLGYCGSHPVFPASCLHTLRSQTGWLREGRKVRGNEGPTKTVKGRKWPSSNQSKVDPELANEEEGSEGGLVHLFGIWQTDEWAPPPAVNGRVPRNERGQVDVWSEKCLPAGTVHLALPRLVPVVQELGFDFAPAMVGFEVKGGRSFPKFQGLVVCEEHKDVILEAYMAREKMREEKELEGRKEAAFARWHQLIRSIVTRRRLRDAYEEPAGSAIANPSKPDIESNIQLFVDDCKLMQIVGIVENVERPQQKDFEGREIGETHEVSQRRKEQKQSFKAKNREQKQSLKAKTSRQAAISEDISHIHVYPTELQTFNEETGIQEKKCKCGFTMYMEVL